MVIVDTEGRFPDAESIKGLLYDLIDCMQVCAEEGMTVPHLHHFLTLLLPTERQVRAIDEMCEAGLLEDALPEELMADDDMEDDDFGGDGLDGAEQA